MELKLKLNNKKGFGISNKGITSGFFEFNYLDINEVNKLGDLFKIQIGELVCNCCINQDSQSPIVIETETIKYNCKRGQGKTGISGVKKSYIKLDIFIDDFVCGLIRVEELTII